MMKYNKTVIIAALTISTLLVSCDKEVLSEAGGTGIPIQIVPSVAGADTKASIGTDDLTEFYMQIDCQDSTYSYFERISKTDAVWGTDRKLYWKDETTPITYTAAFFSGHAFTKAEFKDSVNLTVPTDQSTQAKLNCADLLTVKATQIKYENTAGGKLPVALYHGLAKVNFVLTLGDDFYDNKFGLKSNPLQNFTVKGANQGFNFKPQTGKVTVTANTKADITPLEGTYTPGTNTAKTATVTYEAILVPQTFAAGELSVTFGVGQEKYSWKNATAITLAAGTTVNLLVSVTTAPDPYNGHAYMDMGNGLKWATCNVGATNPENYGDHFAWGETETKTVYNWGTYQWMENGQYIWERITKYTFADNQKNGTWWYDGDTFKGDKGDGVEYKDFASYDYADDAARHNWGGNWRTPTNAEWTWLRDDNNCTWTWTTQNGVNGMLVTSKINGNQIFLPAAGYRNNANLNDDGSRGFYWSSSLDESISDYARGVYFGSGGVSTYSGNRYYGQSVRPVCE